MNNHDVTEEKCIWYNPLTWPTWGKIVGGISAIGVIVGGYFGFKWAFPIKKESTMMMMTSKMSKNAKIAGGILAAGAVGALGAYQMGYLGNKEEVTDIKRKTRYRAKCAPKEKKSEESSVMSGWVIALIVIIL